MRAVLLLVLVSIVGLGTAQKLFFKSFKKLEKNREDVSQGFGFKEPRPYFTFGSYKKTKDDKITEGVVVCPDKKTACPDRNTCCMTKAMKWGCCRLPNATCCQDREHCCPFRSTCDVLRRVCVGADFEVPWFEKKTAIQLNTEDKELYTVLSPGLRTDIGLGSVICPDGQHECEDGQTCCKKDGSYECCPLPNADCCSDGIHCCPHGYTCDVAHSRCVASNGHHVTRLFQKQPSPLVKKTVKITRLTAVKCDDQHECPTGYTCCKAGDQFGCCPMPNAVCCADGVHCCPENTVCDTFLSTCNATSDFVQHFEKIEPVKVGNVRCDPTHECSNGQTCCNLGSGEWGCCPLPHAVCCSDHTHCCPNGYTCDSSSGKCNKGSIETDWFEKAPAIKRVDIQCDATHSCPSGNTCCRLGDSQWGCCPLPNAVCCSDHTHCCPNGYTCESGSGKCTKGSIETDWFEKVPAIKRADVQCDATHSCPSGNTCCRLGSSQWGCCPLPNAVCCSDDEHCCPNGYTCDSGSGKCNKGSIETGWFEKVPAIKRADVQCDATHSCPSGNTCCRLGGSQWGCCPLPNAVCCSDHTHCCPNGYTCDSSSGKCNKGSIETDWFEKVPAIKRADVQCDATHSCPSGNTCCRLGDSQWGCCPLPNAVCCSDHTHCCPNGYTCSSTSGKCTKGSIEIDWFEKVPAIKRADVQCDATHSCPSGNTCCRLGGSQWGCCPLPNAVCCSDDEHCCPNGYTCESGSGKCTKGSIETHWFEKVPAIKRVDVQCDATHSCPSGNTCCRLGSSQWGCCPLPNAVCCSDDEHCCPNGYTCESGSGKCTKGSIETDWFEKVPAIKRDDVQCDATHSCPSGNTCCRLGGSQWGCCPLPNAVCCSDDEHCCPNGYTCESGSGKCTKGSIETDWVEKVPAIKRADVQCDATHSCPSGNTCCRLGSSQWGCCPLPNAVCCSDDEHCCPNGYTCDSGSGKCNKGSIETDWFEKVPAIKRADVQCDATHSCPSGNTCCRLGSSQWGCCPLPNAVCCSDDEHCCPNGYTCESGSGKCTKGSIETDWVEKVPAIKRADVQCDATHSCPSGNTCCRLGSSQWGCCPLPNAVCCSDDEHCCPNGYTCDSGSGKCNKGSIETDWFEKVPAIKRADVQCDATHSCPSGNTCCRLGGSQWGCCPLPNAVCCSDDEHCCPNGYTCESGSGKCTKGSIETDWVEKVPAIKRADVQCDATHSCPSGNTCCRLGSSQWGCCPLPNAVCCSDDEHCCPNGYTCDSGSGKCNKGSIETDWFEKVPAIKRADVQCDATHSCPSGNTCCRLGGSQWGCCPLPNAVCCSDDEHCCPNGYTCESGSGKCTKGSIETDWFEKVPAIKRVDVQCDATHSCPSGNTCCRLGSSQWGCCPLPNAVCCSDDEHCCPNGYTCASGSGKCIKGSIETDWFEKVPAIKRVDVQCDATHSCPSGNTCCRLGDSQWGCCPLPNAVCCSDHTHCCPNGYTCDSSSGKCNKGSIETDWFEKVPAIKRADVQCDATHSCPSGNTCCRLGDSQWGCCPLPNAVCCSDHTHCCPNGYTCSSTSGKCTKGSIETDWFEKVPAIKRADVQCDATHSCPSGNTCCRLGGSQWGCCPLPNAVCCSDDEHCCPNGYTCASGSGKCIKGSIETDWFEKVPAIKRADVQCDGTHSCPSGNTCCRLGDSQWGCCPLPNAVCCSDDEHCCPNGYTCDSGSGKCTKGSIETDWFEKVPAIKRADVQCDGTHSCPSGNTCCRLGDSQWGCCPLPNAVYCSDHTHCCPNGYTCDPSSGKCSMGDIKTDWFKKVPAMEIKNVICDSTHQCPDGNTCCKIGSEQWGCCSMPNAVCCSDGHHCCPSGTTCNLQNNTCVRGGNALEPMLKTRAIDLRSATSKEDPPCSCGSNQTCCMATGMWGCCPYQNAVCCAGGQHCCPGNTKCGSSGSCIPADTSMTWLNKEPALEVGIVQCDSTSYCPDGSTCCRLTTGEWGCCPLEQAECCADGIHCCPNGYTCDTASGQCLGKHQATLAQLKIDTHQMPSDLLMVTCPDGSLCQDAQTCCKMDEMTGSYGCCPLPNAVCCNDDQHCCPESYSCDLTKGACVKGNIQIPWIDTSSKQNKVPQVPQEAVAIVPCPGSVTCPDGYSCCDDGQGSSLCCPYATVHGVCCNDHEHCCPHGYICDEGDNTCRIPETGKAASNFLQKLKARKATPLI